MYRTAYELMTVDRSAPERRTSRPAVLEAGLRIADTEGLAGLSIRRLADELGVGTMTIYSYISTKEELLDGIATLVLNEIPRDDPGAAAFEERLELAVQELHVALREHPGVAEIVASRGAPIPALDRFREALLSILADAGLPPENAVSAVSALAAYASGFAQVELQRAQVDPEAEASRLRRLPQGDFPHLTGSADAYASHVSQDAFTLGLRSFVRGLASTLAE